MKLSTCHSKIFYFAFIAIAHFFTNVFIIAGSELPPATFKLKLDEIVSGLNNGKIETEDYRDLMYSMPVTVSTSCKMALALSTSEEKIINSIFWLAEELIKNPNDTYLTDKIKSIKLAYTDYFFKRASNFYKNTYTINNILYGKEDELINAMALLSTINNDFRKLTKSDNDKRDNLRDKIYLNAINIETPEFYQIEISKIFDRPTADANARLPLENMLRNRLEVLTLKQSLSKSQTTESQTTESPTIGSQTTEISNKLDGLKEYKSKELFNWLQTAERENKFTKLEIERFDQWRKNNKILVFRWTWNPIHLLAHLLSKFFWLFNLQKKT